MTRHLNRWTAVFGWAVLMLIVWALFVPKGISTGTFTLFGLTGALLLISGSVLWRTQQQWAPSIRQTRAMEDAAGSAGTNR